MGVLQTQKPMLKDENGEEVDVHMYRSMIGSLMYLTSSRPDIIDYAGASLDRKSTTGGCQFLGCRLISWQCKKQTVVANSITEAEYVAASSCCGQVLWIQNQLLDYGSLGTTSGSGPRCQDTIGDTIAQTRFENVSKHSNIPLLARDNDITLVSVQDDADKEMFNVNALDGEEVFVAGQNENVVEEIVDAAQVSTAVTTVTITTEEILVQALEALKTSKPKDKGKDEEEVTIDAIPLAVKSPSIVGWKIHKEERKSYYQIIRTDGKSQMYMIFSHMLKSFDMEDLETLYNLVKAKYKSTKPMEYLDLVASDDLRDALSVIFGLSELKFHKGSTGHKSRHYVYLNLNIRSIQSIKVNKKFGYAYLEEILVTRTDEKEYKFYEADFPNLNQNDIEDMYMLKIQNKVRNIKGTEEFDLVNILRMYIHRIVIMKRVKDMQMEVKSYQTKLNLTKPQLKEGCLHQFTPYTIMNHPRGVVYEGVDNKKRLTMNSINSLMIKDDEKKTKMFIEKIEKTLKEQRIFERLELFVGGRRDNTDYRLLIRPE
ncbi:hypothetical protein Tco_0026615 [Tanacetum coccineum]